MPQPSQAFGNVVVADVEGRHEPKHVRPRLEQQQPLPDAGIEDVAGAAGVRGTQLRADHQARATHVVKEIEFGVQLRPAHAGRAGDILDACIGQGLLLLQAGPDVLRFVPALNIGDDDIAEGLRRLRRALAGCLAPG